MPLPPIIYEDDALIAFDKPGGLPVAPERWDKSADHLVGRVQATGWAAKCRACTASTPSPSGVVLFAKTKPALDFLSGQFQSKTVVRTYTRVCESSSRRTAPWPGVAFAAGGWTGGLAARVCRWTSPLAPTTPSAGPHAGFPASWKQAQRDPVPPSRIFRALRHGSECRPLTGSVHQVRVHLATAGAPGLERCPLRRSRRPGYCSPT